MLRHLSGGGRVGRTPLLVLLAVAIVGGFPPPLTAQDAAPAVAIRAGTVHPVSGPPIEDGVVLIRGSRIVAVGSAADVEIPDGATVFEHPDGHVYPGLVDALSTAFAGEVIGDGNVDAGAAVGTALNPFDEPSGELVRSGVTTAYVANRSGAAWRGQGALIRPQDGGFVPFPEADPRAVHLRLTTGPGAGHPLQRIEQLDAQLRELEQLESYEKAFEDHAKKLEEYEKKFAEYLEWHRKRAKDGKSKTGEEKPPEGEGGDAKPATERPAGGEGRRGGERRGGRRGGRGGPPAGGEPAEQKPAAGETAKPAGDGEKPAEAAKETEEKAPERPKYPPEPKRDPGKDALIELRDGKLRLFVEAHRPDEVRRALELAREKQLRGIVLEYATGAAGLVEELAASGTAVIVDSALPPDLSRRGETAERFAPDDLEGESLAARLAAADVPFAIGSGSIARARHLPCLVAEAVGQGVPIETALRAVTLTPAQILGIGDRVGSLEPNKLADVLVTSHRIESSDARVLRVISAGRTVHEAR